MPSGWFICLNASPLFLMGISFLMYTQLGRTMYINIYITHNSSTMRQYSEHTHMFYLWQS
jgi:hypothetical protein